MKCNKMYPVFNTFASPIYVTNPKFMKNLYLFFFIIASHAIFAQSNCDDANSYIVNAYSHVKDAYEANNISHLKYYSNRSLEAFKLSKKNLKDCDCETALELANKSIDYLAKVDYAETYEDGRFYVKRARDISKSCMIEIDKCSVITTDNDAVLTSASNNLSDLQKEQIKLKQQQEALKLKEQDIKKKLAQQKEKELLLKKEQLILSYKNAISSNIKTYNDALKVCKCKHNTIKDNDFDDDVSTESIEAIKVHYTNSLKAYASNYLSELNSCNK